MTMILSAILAVASFAADVPERWAPKEIAGERFRAGYYAGQWVQYGWKEAPAWRIFGDRMLPQFFSYRTIGLLPTCPAAERWRKPTYAFEDCYDEDVKKGVERYERDFPGQPYFIILNPGDFRTSFFRPSAKPDEESFLRWRAKHPSFCGFRSVCEWDCFFQGHFEGWHPLPKDPELAAVMTRDFPLSLRRFDEQLVTIDRSIVRQRASMFGCRDTFDIFSTCPTWAHVCARAGTKMLTFEAELNATGGGWSAATWFTRGAARQWGVPWCWYQASYVISTDRQGNRYDFKTDRRGNRYEFMNEVRRKGREDVTELCGASFSLLSRGWHYGWFAGASVLEAENYDHYFIEDGPDGKTRPTKYAKEFNSVFELDDKVDRGVPYTPCAYLCSIGELFTRFGYTNARDPLSLYAFFWTLAPTKVKEYYSFRDNHGEGCFWNSPFGEMGDVICPDAGQKTEDFSAALAPYSVAILVGEFLWDRIDAAAIARYVKGGGRLCLNRHQLDALNGKLVKDGAEPLEPSAHVALVPDFVDAEFRADKSVYYPDKFKRIASGEKTFPVVDKLMRRLQDRFLPIAVEGDVQWGVNRTRKGWLVWFLNNKGVTKYALEEQIIDSAYDAEVKVTCKSTGEVKSVTVPAGGYAYVEFAP